VSAESSSEVDRLRAWKAEAMAVLDEWERTWEVAGRPGGLGALKARATADEIRRLQRLTPGQSKFHDLFGL